MNTTRLRARLIKLEQRMSPVDLGTFTLEELCRAMWQRSKGDFLKLSRETNLGLFTAQFEREDAERHHSTRRPAT